METPLKTTRPPVLRAFGLFGGLALLVPMHVVAQQAADHWTYSVMPYLWLPSMNATLRYGPPPTGGASPDVGAETNPVLSALDMAFLIAAEARNGRWSLATDMIYLDFASDSSAVNSIDFNPGSGSINVANTALNKGTQTDLRVTVWTLVGGYAAVQDPRVALDVIGGFRYVDLRATTNWQLSATVAGPVGAQTFARTGSVTKSEELWDAIVGVRGRVKLGEGNWFMPYYVDAGAGDSKLTWQSMLGVGHAFKWGDMILSYRYLSYEQGDNKMIENLKFGGLGLGASFRF